jgi:hypothetical protein
MNTKEKKMKKKNFTLIAALIAACLCTGLYAGLFTACDTGDTSPPEPTAWTVGTVPGLVDSYPNINSIAYANGVGFVIAAGNDTAGVNTTAVAKSTTGTDSWTVSQVSGLTNFSGSPGTVRWLHDKFIATKGSGGYQYAITSTDGTDWTDDTIGFGTKGFAYGSRTYLVAGSGGRVSYSSSDTPWTTVELTAFDGNGAARFLNAAAYGNSKFVVGGGNGRTAVSTNKGVTWTLCALDGPTSPKVIFDSGFINAMVFFNEKFIALGGLDNTVAKSAYSTDGLTWTQGDDTGIKTGSNTPHMVTGGGYIVAVDTDGKAIYSADGIKWTSINIGIGVGGANGGIKDIAYGNGRFVAISGNGDFAYSNEL